MERDFDKKLVPIGQAAEFLGVSVDTVRRWDEKGILHSERPDGKDRYFSITELEKIKFSEPLSISEAAQKLNISETTLRRLEEKGLIKPERNAAGERVYTLDCLEDFIRSDYYLRQGVIEDKILNDSDDSPADKADYKEDIQSLREQHKVLNAQIEDHKKHLGKLNNLRKAFYYAGVSLIIFLVMLVVLSTALFIMYPAKTAKWFGYSSISAQAASGVSSTTTTSGGSFASTANQTSLLSKFLQPIGGLSLEVVRRVSPTTYNTVLATQPINDVNDIFSVNEAGNIVTNYNLTFPNSSYLIIPDTTMIKNLNAEMVQGKVPGINPGDLVSWNPNNSIDGLIVNSANIVNNSITSEKLADGSVISSKIADNSITTNKIVDGAISQVKLGTISETNKVAGSAVQLSIGGGLTDKVGLSLKTDCNVGEILNWTGSAWECIAQSKSAVTKILTTSPLSYDTASGTLSLDTVKADAWDLAYLHISDTNNPHNVTSAQVLPAQPGQNGKVLGTNGTAVAWISNSSNVSWGAITGTLTDQSDLVVALATKESTLTAGTSGQYYRGDKTWQTLNATAVSLGNVDNTSDLNKPVSTATSTALGLKVDKTTTVNSKALSSNITLDTSDVADTTNKRYVSDAQILVINAQSGTNTGDETNSTIKTKLGIATLSGSNTGDQDLSGLVPKTYTVNGHALSSNISVTTTDLGLANVDNTSDLNKPVSTATATALGLKVDKTTTVNNKALSSNITLDTSDVADTTNKRYVSDAQILVINAQSGTNTGDETNSTIKTKLGITTLSGSNTGDQDLSGLVAKTTTVNGHALSSNVSITTTDLGLNNVDNTSDLNKPVSTATSTALGLKVDKTTTINSKALSGNIALDTSDIADTTNKRYVSDAQLVILGNTSGANTGDETASTIKSKLGVTVLSGSNTGDQTNISGNAGTVTNATLTTALTVNTGTVTIVGNGANTSVLTIGAGAVSVLGSNTGDQDLSGLVPKTYTVNSKALSGNITLSTADIADSTDKRYVSDANLVVIGNTSGTNTGDETATTIKNKLSISTLSGSNTGDQTLNGLLPTQTGNNGKVLSTNGTDASWISNSSGVAWGAITGTLSDQTDLGTALSGKQSASSALSSVAGLTYVSPSFVKMTGASTFALDTNTYLTSLSGAALLDQSSGQIIGDTTNRLTKLWTTDLTVTNAMNGSITGNAATVTTNANLTGEVTSTGNSTTVTNSAVIGKVLTGYTSGAGVVTASDTILQAIQKLNGNVAASGSGTVTSVSVVTANGVSGSVATESTTPAITLTLGTITPTSVNGLTLAGQTTGFTIAGGTASKTLTVGDNASVSGSNTGDQTNITGNAGTVTGLSVTSGKTLTAQNSLTLSGTDGSTLAIGTGGTLGTAAYTASTAYQAASSALTSVSNLTYVSPSFVKMTGANTFALDTNTYLTSLSGAVLTDQSTPQTIGDTTNRLAKLWTTDLTATNTITGSVSGNAGSVTNATLTTALTVNTGTVTIVGNVANSSVLTIGAGSVSVSGSNTGDQDLSGLVPKTYTINSQALSGNITLSTADIADSTDKRYVTDAQKTVIGNTSGTNTGDQTNITGNAGTVTGLSVTSGKTLTVQNSLTLSGTDGSTLAIGAGGTLGTAAYTAATAYETANAGLTSLAGLTYVSPSFVKMTGANTFTLDTSTYLTSLSGAVLTSQATPQTIGDTTNRLTKLWTTDLTATNTITGSISGNAGSVTNATLTTALTVNTGTVTIVGNVANSSVLTIGAGAVSVSGSNTGDQDLSGLVPKTYTVNSKALSGNIVLDTSDIADTTNKRYVSDAQLVILGNTSGTNSGDNATNSSTTYIGTTAIALNRASASQALTGITSIDGSAATLTTTRAIYGNNFDGSAALTQIIASTYGGTGNGFAKFTGPTTSEKTFTLPNSSETLLYSGGALGTPASGVATNLTGTASGLSIGGNAATVTNATLSTAITVNTGTLTLTANSANTSVLTIGAGAVSVSGSNTGDQTLAGLGGVATTRSLTINGTAYDLSADRTWTITNISGNAGTVTGLSVTSGKTLTAQNSLTLSGTDGSTLAIGTGGILGTAAYTAATAYQSANAGLTSLAGLTYVSPSFVKMTGANTFTLDTGTYLTSLSGAVLTSQATPQTIGDTTNRLAKLWTTDLTATNAITGSITGNAATVTTNANLTGVITSVGNATSIASQTGTGTKFVVDTSPVLVTPTLGDASATSLTLTLGTAQDYLFTNRGDNLAIQGQKAATASQVELFSNDGAGSTGANYIAWGLGTPSSITNSEWGSYGYSVADLAYTLLTNKAGTGTLRSIIFKPGNTTALTLAPTTLLATFAGHLAVEGVTSTGATGTGKFVFDTSPTLTTPTLGIAGYTSLTGGAITATGNIIAGTDKTYTLGTSSVRWNQAYLGLNGLSFYGTTYNTQLLATEPAANRTVTLADEGSNLNNHTLYVQQSDNKRWNEGTYGGSTAPGLKVKLLEFSYDTANWRTNAGITITAKTSRYNDGFAQVYVSCPYTGGSVPKLIYLSTDGGNYTPNMYLGTPELVSGTIYKVAVYQDVPTYYQIETQIEYDHWVSKVDTITAVQNQIAFPNSSEIPASTAWYTGYIDIRRGLKFASDTSANLYFSATGTLKTDGALVAGTSITDAGLTATYVTYAGASGLLTNSANFTYDSTAGLQLAASNGLALGGTPAGRLGFWNTGTKADTSTSIYGFADTKTITGTNTATYGLYSAYNLTGTNTVSTAYGILHQLTVNAGTTATTSYGLRIQDPTGAGTVTNNYGIYIDSLAKGGTVNHGIYLAGTGTGNDINWSGDTNLYRSAPDTLSTDDLFTTGSGVNVYTTTTGAGLNFYSAAAGTFLGGLQRVVNEGGATAVIQLAGTTSRNLELGNSASSVNVYSTSKIQWNDGAGSADTNLYRLAANSLKTDDAFTTAGALSSAGLIYSTGGDIYTSSANAGATNTIYTYNSDNTSGTSNAKLLAKVGGASGGDPVVGFNITSVQDWMMGVDNSDSDAFVIAPSSALGSSNALRISTAGAVTLTSASAGANLLTLGSSRATDYGLVTFNSYPNATDNYGLAGLDAYSSLTGSRVRSGFLGFAKEGAGTDNKTKYQMFLNNGTTFNDVFDISSAGHVTLEGVTSTGKTGSGGFVFDTSPTLITPTIGVATATSIAIGANTLDTNEWAYLDGQNQAVKTTSTPAFAGLGIGTYNAANLLTFSQAISGTTATTTAMRINSTITTTSGLGAGLVISPTVNTSSGNVASLYLTGTYQISDTALADAFLIAPTVTPATSSSTTDGIYITSPVVSSGTLGTNYAIRIGNQSTATTNYGIMFAGTGVGNGINWGTDSPATNLYKSTTSTVKTDGNMVIVGSLGVTGTRVTKGWFTDLESTNAITVGGVSVPTISSTNTLTNKRVTPRVGTTTSSATPTINTDNYDEYTLTAQAADITSMTTNLSGTPTDGQTLHIAITGTAARAITWGTSFEASTVALPTTTVTTNRLDVEFVWNSVTSKWRITKTY